jgi:hypothetical protein
MLLLIVVSMKQIIALAILQVQVIKFRRTSLLDSDN